MKTIRERKGLQKAQHLIAKKIKALTDWCRDQGCHVAVCVVDAGGKDVAGEEDNVSRVFGPHAGSGIDAALEIIDRCLAYTPPDHLVEVVNLIRKWLDAKEKGYWENLEDLPTGQDPTDDDGKGG